MFEFVYKHLNANPRMLYLSLWGKRLDFSAADACLQIECRQNTRRKLARFLEKQEFVFPSREAAEQSTHQCVANYHASIIGRGRDVVDLTAGLGIDALTSALNGNNVTAIEMDAERYRALTENVTLFKDEISEKGGGIEVIEGDSMRWLREKHCKPDIIFIDPARRDEGRRVFRLSDCTPDVLSNYELLVNSGAELLIKASPLLDLKSILVDLPQTSEIHIICVKGECKEVLIRIKPEGDSEANEGERGKVESPKKIIIKDLADNEKGDVVELSSFECTLDDLHVKPLLAETEQLEPGAYIYDVNAGIHKARAAGKLCMNFDGLRKISSNTDLFISNRYFSDFPGRVFRLDSLPDRKELKRLKGEPVEVISRNYPMNAIQVKDKYSLGAGEDRFLICFRTGKKETPAICLCTRIKNDSALRQQEDKGS